MALFGRKKEKKRITHRSRFSNFGEPTQRITPIPRKIEDKITPFTGRPESKIEKKQQLEKLLDYLASRKSELTAYEMKEENEFMQKRLDKYGRFIIHCSLRCKTTEEKDDFIHENRRDILDYIARYKKEIGYDLQIPSGFNLEEY